MAEGLYRIGECIYMEVNPPPLPYQICKIEELRKNSKGSVEVAAKCFYRRRDLPSNLLAAADRHAMAVDEESEADNGTKLWNGFDKLEEMEAHLIRHRELFLSRQIETYKIDMVRGKCTVSLLNELEDIHTYLDKEDAFFFTMVYDPTQKTLLVDKGEIRVGTDYQAEISPYVDPEAREPVPHTATQVWEPNRLPDSKVEQFLVVARSIGTFARALLDGAKKPQISLRLGAAAASRDITLFHAMDTLHQNGYDITQATSCLVPRGPVLCADELEAWTQEEAKRFEDGLQEQKDFLSIQRKFLPWKPVKSIVAYYYMWKTTDRYQVQKRHRMIEKQNDLKEVIVHLRSSTGAPAGARDLSGKAASSGTIPKTLPEDVNEPVGVATDGEKGCESCHVLSATRWYNWGSAHDHCRLCNFCYTYWRKYAGLKLPNKWETHEKRTASLGGATVTQPKKPKSERGTCRSGKKRGDDKRNGDIVPPLPFHMRPTGMAIYMRQKVGKSGLQKSARTPFNAINTKELEAGAADVNKFLLIKRKGFRKPRLSEPTVESLKQNVQQNPIRVIRPSPTPISPSYKAKSNTKSNKGRVSSSGAYISPKTQNGPPSTAVVAAVAPPVSVGANSSVAKKGHQNSGTSNSAGLSGAVSSRKRKLENSSSDGMPPSKVVCPSKPVVMGPEIFFKVDSNTVQARDQLGRPKLLKAARCPNKTIHF